MFNDGAQIRFWFSLGSGAPLGRASASPPDTLPTCERTTLRLTQGHRAACPLPHTTDSESLRWGFQM